VRAVVIGAGAVGLAVAAELGRRGADVLVLERAASAGTGTTARSSEVVHAGFYYAPGSLKARWCAPGRRRLYEYLAARGVAHARLGKLVVATTEAEIPVLEGYLRTGAANGVEGLELVDATEVARLEPAVAGVAALRSAETGIFDSHGFVQALVADVEANGGQVVCGCEVEGVDGTGPPFPVRVRQHGSRETVIADLVVNAAGLWACDVARGIEALDPARIPEPRYVRGRYYRLRGRSPFRRLVYPVAEAAGLGIHVTLDLGNAARFGPDTEWVDRQDYAFVDALDRFVAGIRRYWPDVRREDLVPGHTGIRPRVARDGAIATDFVFEGPQAHGVPGLACLYGIESPGLTASLVLAEDVVGELRGASFS
jgi:L-2-hydroxyglutarate oxidase LhgO